MFGRSTASVPRVLERRVQRPRPQAAVDACSLEAGPMLLASLVPDCRLTALAAVGRRRDPAGQSAHRRRAVAVSLSQPRPSPVAARPSSRDGMTHNFAAPLFMSDTVRGNTPSTPLFPAPPWV